MKRLLSVLLALGTALTASAAVISTNFTSPPLTFANSGLIPDGNLSGWTDSRSLNFTEYAGWTITDVNVTLNISGGWNGDLYGYLVHDSGFAVLLDRVGKDNSNPYGYGNAGFSSVTLDDQASVNITAATGSSYSAASAIATGTYQSQGLSLSDFNGELVNGTWTLFLADMSFGDQSTLVSWSLEITAVPEPTTWAVIGFGAIFAAYQLHRFRARKA